MLRTSGSKHVCLHLSVLALLLWEQGPAAQAQAPSNSPAKIVRDGQTLRIEYDNTVIFEGTIQWGGEAGQENLVTSRHGEAIDQAYKLTGHGVRLAGTVTAGTQSFPCEVDRKQRGVSDVIRHSSGLSHSLLNRAVYDRQHDWVLSIDYFAAVAVQPAKQTNAGTTYSVNASGDEITIRFRPRYYQIHRGLKYYEPWTYSIREPVVGWCSWFAYWNRVTQQDIRTTADVLAERLVPYGLTYLQIDDGYQQEPIGVPDHWLHANDKFPDGMDGLARYIASKGLKPGVWTNVAFQDRDWAFAHKEYFVLNDKGEPAYGNWVGYVMDGSNPATIDTLIRPVYRGFADTGWVYFKLDALRHLRYEGYNSFSDHFAKKNADRAEAFRDVVKAVRKEIGPDNYLMGCWGARPELIGLIDACRVGDDGFRLDCMAQFNSFNNVVWQIDPDHIELTPEQGYRSCLCTSMTGSLYMLTDKAEKYQTEVIEPARRTIPVLFTRPGQIYDVDPTRSMFLDRVETEMSGSGPRVCDASNNAPYDLYLLEINRPYENWVLLGRFDERKPSLQMSEMGLDGNKEYLAFEFWTKSFAGQFKGRMPLPKIDAKYGCQLFCLREKQDHPQLLATNRHISCGGLELDTLAWQNQTLSGTSRTVPNDAYTLYIHEPAEFGNQPFDVEVPQGNVVATRRTGPILQVDIQCRDANTLAWGVRYK
ncbi:MAG: glycoside hydrolase family 36 protein [Phycisphaerales bacterium]